MQMTPKNVTPMRVPVSLSLIRPLAALGLALVLAGCVSTAAPRLDDSGAARKAYMVSVQNVAAVRARALDTVNTSRAAQGLAPVSLDAALTASADGHARDMAVQRRAWAFGSDGSSPIARAKAQGFTAPVIGELVSQTYETEVQTIATWMDRPEQRAILMSPKARRIGLGVMQEDSGMLWWTLTVAE